jgi:hypothetical protein
MSKPKGGRGKKAPYETMTIRVPVPLVSEFNKLIGEYVYLVTEGLQDPNMTVIDLYKSMGVTHVTRDKAIMEAKRILRLKKSSKQSIEKLLQVLYGDEINLKDYD